MKPLQSTTSNISELAAKEWGKWCAEIGGELYLTLNTQRDLDHREQIGQLISKLFYHLECDEFTYMKRERYKRTCRIQRLVFIETAGKLHAHVMLKRYGSYTDAEIVEKVAKKWHELNNTAYTSNRSSYLVNTRDYTTRNEVATAIYSAKDTKKESAQLQDVLDLRSSFISKHSNMR